MQVLCEFDELYVISDLHIGGSTGFQVFEQSKLLSRLIEWVKSRQAQRVGFVINGDSVDFLAEAPFKYFDPVGAIKKLDRIFGDPNFKPVWESLSSFVSRRNRTLIITLGNHDLELALPWVREHFLNKLANGNDAARGRIKLSFEGAGFASCVAGSSVLSLHGNDFDPFNFTNYEMLRSTGADVQMGQCYDEWVPNAGTKLVVDVMNGIKAQFPFVDLLKPEDKGVLPILAELEPDRREKLEAVWAVAEKLVWDNSKRVFRSWFLSADEAAAAETRMNPLHRFLGEVLPGSTHVNLAEVEGGELLAGAERDLNTDPLDLIDAEETQRLGLGRAVWRIFTGAESHEVLFEALQSLKEDRSFDLRDKDSLYRKINDNVGSCFRFVTTGHTHLERVLPWSGAGSAYFNSGTWIPLMRFTDEMLKDERTFREMFKALRQSRTLQDLKTKVVNGKNILFNHPAVVRFDSNGGSLCRVQPAGDSVELQEVTQQSKNYELNQ